MGLLHYIPNQNKPNPHKLFIAIPVMGNFPAGFVHSFYNSATILKEAGIEAEVCILEGSPHVDSNRNLLVSKFLSSDCTDFLFIDADMKWEPQDIIRMLNHKEDIVGATYKMKQSKEEYPVVLLDGEKVSKGGLLKVKAVPTGFLRIKRKVLEELFKVSNKYQTGEDKDPTPLIFERVFDVDAFVGGDYIFCRKARKLGYDIYLDTLPRFSHIGVYNWYGSYGQFLAKQSDTPLEYAFSEIKSGSTDVNIYKDLWDLWDNSYATNPEVLITLALLVPSYKTIIEYGAGLSTLVMASANPDCHITSIEGDKEYAESIRAECKKYDIKNVTIIDSDIKNDWFTAIITDEYDMGFIDAPVRSTCNNRKEFVRALPNIKTAVIVDDAEQMHVDILKENGFKTIMNHNVVIGKRS